MYVRMPSSLKAIKHSHEASDGTYSSPHVVRDLIDAGIACSENRVARLMKAAGIKGHQKRVSHQGNPVRQSTQLRRHCWIGRLRRLARTRNG
ncbi:IS3 family transposase [Massilia suwonensis]|uniref:IS3 family transposase n=1 Tax=Massilia suwonensis TaxID=648895 RepID=A0ABW0MJ68_9BURK